MKNGVDKKKGTEIFSSIVQSTVNIGKKTVSGAKNNVDALVKKSKTDSYSRKLKKYNPLFLEEYNSENFNLPNMIMIVDDAVRKDIDVCKGSIGWLSKETGIEVLYLYDEAVSASGIQFIPSVSCDAIYYVDGFDRRRFIRVDCIFSKAHEERMAELKHIAHSLGAKSCTIEINESNFVSKKSSKGFSLKETYKAISSDEKLEQGFSSGEVSKRSGCIKIEFEGNDIPTKPELKWFAHDDNIKRLIEMRCNGINSVKAETLELSGSSSATMSQKTACTIDGAIGKMGGIKGASSMDYQAEKEHHSKMLFHIEFLK